MTKKKTPFEEAAAEIDMRLGGLLENLGSALSEALSRMEDQSEVHHETTFDSARGPVRASAGVKIRTLHGGAAGGTAPRQGRRPDKPVTPAPAADTPPPEAEPAAKPISATILVEEGAWRLVAELPGAGEADLTLSEEDGTLTIRADARSRRYEGQFALPKGARPEDLGRSLQNGILELTWEGPQ